MYIVGIDIAKRKHEAAVIDGDGAVIIKPFSFTNNCSGYNRLLAMLTKAKLPLEAPGSCDEMLREIDGYESFSPEAQGFLRSLIGAYKDIANESEVDAVLQRALVTVDYIHISTCQTEGIHAVSLKLGNQVLVYQTAIYHGNYLQHISIGDATAVHHLALYAEGCGYLGGTAATAMYQYFLAGNGCKILQELCQLLAVFNDGTAYLYYCYFFHLILC